MHAHRAGKPVRVCKGMSMDAVESILQICRAIRREAETLPDQAPGMNQVAAGLLTAASDYIIARENPEALERLDDAIRATGKSGSTLTAPPTTSSTSRRIFIRPATCGSSAGEAIRLQTAKESASWPPLTGPIMR